MIFAVSVIVLQLYMVVVVGGRVGTTVLMVVAIYMLNVTYYD